LPRHIPHKTQIRKIGALEKALKNEFRNSRKANKLIHEKKVIEEIKYHEKKLRIDLDRDSLRFVRVQGLYACVDAENRK